MAPIILIHLLTPEGIVKCKTLVDSGASGTVLKWAKARHFKIETLDTSHSLTTVMGNIKNIKYARIKFKLPQFSPTLTVEWNADVLEDMSNLPYDMIIGRDVMTELNLDVLASDATVTMNDIKIPWIPRGSKTSSLFHVEEQENSEDAGDRIRRILDAKYAPADLMKVVAETGLESSQQKDLLDLLNKYRDLFDGTLGTFNMEPYDIQLVEGAKPYHLKRAYTVPQAYLQIFK